MKSKLLKVWKLAGMGRREREGIVCVEFPSGNSMQIISAQQNYNGYNDCKKFTYKFYL
jgi:hypothetical protein